MYVDSFFFDIKNNLLKLLFVKGDYNMIFKNSIEIFLKASLECFRSNIFEILYESYTSYLKIHFILIKLNLMGKNILTNGHQTRGHTESISNRFLIN